MSKSSLERLRDAEKALELITGRDDIAVYVRPPGVVRIESTFRAPDREVIDHVHEKIAPTRKIERIEVSGRRDSAENETNAETHGDN